MCTPPSYRGYICVSDVFRPFEVVQAPLGATVQSHWADANAPQHVGVFRCQVGTLCWAHGSAKCVPSYSITLTNCRLSTLCILSRMS